MSFNNSLNEPNEKLLEKLRSNGVIIDFEITPDTDSWGVKELFHYKITANDEKSNPAALAHELLHIQLEQMGYSGPIEVYKYFNETNSVFTVTYIAELNNTIAHFKMLDDFLQMGYNIDEFLQDTPKEYFLNNIIEYVIQLVLEHKSGQFDACEQARQIIMLCAAAKLFEQYKIKFPETQNGVHPELIYEPLREINPGLIDALDALFQEWNDATTVDNIQCFFRINETMKNFGIPNAADCLAAAQNDGLE
jgi:hypothetical protein